MEPGTRRSRFAPPFAALVIAGVLLLFFWRFGYDWAISDQEEIIPYLLHQLDPSLLQNDWFVQTQISSFSVRDYTVGLLLGIARLLPVWLTIAAVYLGSWLAVAYSSYRVAWELLRDHLASAAVVTILLVFTPQWTLGGNDLIGRMLTPSLIGWALAVPAILLWLRRRWILSGALLGAAAWFQPLVGLQTAGLLTITQFLERPLNFDRSSLKPAFLLGGTFALTALPSIIPIALQQFATSAVPPGHMPSFYQIMAEFRNPHHYLPAEFSMQSYVHFGLLAAAGTAGLLYLRGEDDFEHGPALIRLLVVIAGCLLIGFLGTEVYPILFLIKLQLFKLTVVAKLVLVTLAVGAAVKLVNPFSRFVFFEQPRVRWGLSGLVVAAWSATALGITVSQPIQERLIRPWAHRQTPLGRMERWIRDHTAKDDVFAIPPSNSSFRSKAQRAAIVTFKTFPFKDRQINQWWERLTTLAPIDSIHRGGTAALPRLDRAYHHHSARDWLRIAARYGIDFLLVDSREQDPPLPFPVRVTREPWKLYQLTDR